MRDTQEAEVTIVEDICASLANLVTQLWPSSSGKTNNVVRNAL